MNDISSIGAGSSQSFFGGDTSILGKDDFLKILVTQLRNQDPINPVNADQFASQLAEFSSVEQLQNINSNLEGSIELDLLLNQAINNTMTATLIGKNVRAIGNQFTVNDNGETMLNYNLHGIAQEVNIEIKDTEGNLIRTIKLSDQLSGDQKYAWDGKNDDGQKVEPGNYTFSVEGKDVEGNPVAAESFIVGRIDSVRYQDGNVVLLIGEVPVTLGQVIEIGLDSENEDGRPKRVNRS